ncbi:DNA adenine methylase [Chroococcidiopsis thermalis]|uniref:Site-specific DNA-methyltransferase (adenine-specific) n=1 Tax=Chroococcidiopsis thermalis (strain PCC 7203) TaxID=251229 RepID=K9TYK7_CHRTP|nr:DNA adenine methylase [Chroococcidiopsis thermalis]AFY87089.1 DNA adenine methylase [Chroococcidiopsis thermalis PCC 7203]
MLRQSLQLSLPRPFLKWAGGKSQLISQYIPYFPQKFATYYEPFLGGGAVFFYLYGVTRNDKPTQKFPAVLTDINPELVNVYCCVRDRVEELIELLARHQEQHDRDYYYRVRSQFTGTPVEMAARLIYLNKTCFNGLYRENSKGEFNVPMGKYKNPTICNAELLRLVSVSLQSVVIEVRPFDAILDFAKTPEDFVYFDPPYHPLSDTSNFTGYSRYSFNEKDQIRLRDTFAELARRGVKVMLSNSDCSLVRELYKDFHIHEILATRAINSKAQKRGKITEILITAH